MTGNPNGATARRVEMERAGINPDAVIEQHQRTARERINSSSSMVGWLPTLGGTALAIFGLSRRSLPGLLIALTSGGVTAIGMKRRISQGTTPVADREPNIRGEKVITINRPIDDVYDAWSDVTKLPRILSHLQSVTELGQGKTHWIAKAPFGRTVEWDAEVMVEQENRVISWRSVGDTAVRNVGSVRFHKAPVGRGTEVRVRIEYYPPLGLVGATVAKLFGEEPGQQVEDDLRRFKETLETGEVPTTDNQPRGGSPSSRMDAGMDKVRQFVEAAASVVGTR